MWSFWLTDWREYFNPHSREGSDGQSSYILGTTKYISIHTPVKGVTAEHTAARIGGVIDFNPHSREGSDT